MKIKAYGSHNLLATRQEHFLVLAAAVIVVRGSRGWKPEAADVRFF